MVRVVSLDWMKIGDQLRLIEFERIKGGKPFDISLDWFKTMINEIGQ